VLFSTSATEAQWLTLDEAGIQHEVDSANPLLIEAGGTGNTTGSPSGEAGGDLTGNFPVPLVRQTHLDFPLPIAQGGTGNATGALPMQVGGDLAGFLPNPSVAALNQLNVYFPSGAPPASLGQPGGWAFARNGTIYYYFPSGWAINPGNVGPQGSQGNQGAQGPQGAYGGPQGPQGYQSAVPGPQGFQGEQGVQGEPSVVPGPQGDQGNQGDQGDIGATGADSTVAGPPGDQGDQGNQGFQGDTGADSEVPGPPGNQGFQGDQGDQGDQGVQGDQGFQGPQGDPGIVGPDAAYVNVVPSSGAQLNLPDPVTVAKGTDVTLSATCLFSMPPRSTTNTRNKDCYVVVRQAPAGGPFGAVFSGVKWPGGIAPTVSTAPNAVDRYDFWEDGSVWYGVITGQAFA
jgi:hypothetical protein